MKKGEKQSTIEYITHFRLTEERPTAWVRVDNLRLDESRAKVLAWSYKGICRDTRQIERITLEECAVLREKEEWRALPKPLQTKSTEELWVNAKGEIYCIAKSQDPFMYVNGLGIPPQFKVPLKEWPEPKPLDLPIPQSAYESDSSSVLEEYRWQQ